MATKLPLRRASLALAKSWSLPRASSHRAFASAAAAAGSSLAEGVKKSIARDAALPNPDPGPDSPSAAMVNEHAPYMVATYARPPPVFVQGEGSWLWDVENRKYLDFTAGIAVTSLGHGDAEFTRLLAQQ
ncbi:hypothetical protein E4U53_003896, partial [Claviceps sorghi]